MSMKDENEDYVDLFEDSIAKTKMRPGAMLMGTVIDIENEMIIVSTHSKSEGAIRKWQFLNNDGELEVKVGDEIEVALDLFEDGLGATLLSRDKAKKNKAWSELEKAFETQETIIGKINGKIRGGFTVAVGALRAFLPGSLVDVRPIRDTTFLENRDLEFKVIKIDQKRNYAVLSRRAVVEKEYSEERDELLKTLDDGAIVTGVVKNLTDYGAFINLGGIDGLLHITDMAWRRVRHPSECVEIGQEIKVKVLKYDKDKNRVSLGMKQMGEDPWQNIARRYPAGARVFGKVNNLNDYGCFIEIEGGVEGLVHVSEIDWTNKNVNPSKVVQLGDYVEVMVLEIDEERRRISLGMKQCKVNPWDEFAATHNKGDKITGRIKSITDFGIFIGLDGGIDGLVHMPDISWIDEGEASIRDFKKGDEVETVILAIDAERERISLGVKQLEQDPFQNYLTVNKNTALELCYSLENYEHSNTPRKLDSIPLQNYFSRYKYLKSENKSLEYTKAPVLLIKEVSRLNINLLIDTLSKPNAQYSKLSEKVYSNGVTLRLLISDDMDLYKFLEEVNKPISLRIFLEFPFKLSHDDLFDVEENIGLAAFYQSGEVRSFGQIESVNQSGITCIIDDALDLIDPGINQYTNQELITAFSSDAVMFAVRI